MPGGGDVQLTPAERERMAAFLKKHFSFQGAGKCGWWANGYETSAQAHQEGEAPAKYLTYTPFEQQGLGDRLLGLVSTFLTALVTDRALIIADPVLSQTFEPALVDWRVGPDVTLNITTRSLLNVSQDSVLLLSLQNRVPWLGGPDGALPGGSRRVWAPLRACTECASGDQRGVLTSIFAQQSGRTSQGAQRPGYAAADGIPLHPALPAEASAGGGALMRRSFERMHASGDPGQEQ